MDVAAAAALLNSELNGVLTLMRALKNSEGFLGGKDVFHFTPCRRWQAFSQTLRHMAAPRLCCDVKSVHPCNQVLLTDSTCSEGKTSLVRTERDGKCLPNQLPRRMFHSRCIGQINPAVLETFHLAYWVIDAGYSALASGFASYPPRSNGWHSSSKKNIFVRRTLSLPAINKANMLSVS